MRARYAYLGPAGTFTEAALRQVASPDEVDYLPQQHVVAALEAVRADRADFAVVAIENSVEGAVTAVLDTLAAGDLVIVREVVVPVSFSLVAREGTELVGRPPARRAPARLGAVPRAGCRRTCRTPRTCRRPRTPLPHSSCSTPMRPSTSTRRSSRRQRWRTTRLPVLAEQVADNAAAVTRFVVVGHPGELPAPTGADKTSLVVHLPDNEAGALLTMLEQFATRGVNLSRIESRPIGDELGRYLFSIDAEGHIAEARMAEALMGSAPDVPGRAVPRFLPEGGRRRQRGARPARPAPTSRPPGSGSRTCARQDVTRRRDPGP